jgi:type II secretory pathway pseudopilin PulG
MRARGGDRGYAMAALIVAIAVMAITLSVALPVWRTAVQREREAELVFRGEQYARAIDIFQRRTGGYPLTLDQLEKTRAIRKLYKDPITGGDFQPVFVGQMIGGAPVVPGQQGRGAGGQQGPAVRPGVVTGPTARGAQAPPRGAGGSPFTGGGVGQAGFGTPQTPTAGPIVGVVSRSTGDSLRLYNGRGKYNEWAFVATATTQQAGGPGGPAGAQTPGPAGPRGQGPRGQGPVPQGPRGQPPGPRGPGQPPPAFPGRGLQLPGGGGGARGIQGFPGPGAGNPQR